MRVCVEGGVVKKGCKSLTAFSTLTVTFFLSVSRSPAVVEVKSSLPSGMQSPVGAAGEQRGGGGEGGEWGSP